MKYLFTFLIIISMSGFVAAQSTPSVFTYKVGKTEISLLNENQGQGNAGILIDATADILKETAPNGTFSNAINAFFIKTPDKKILADTGLGKKLFDNLSSLGVKPEDIDILLLTHMHGDHIGGMLKDDKKAFPNAKVYISELEYKYWTSDQVKNELANNVLSAYKDQIVLFTPSTPDGKKEALLPEITAIEAYGHTPGHTMFLVESANDKLLIWGDLTHAQAVQIPNPQVAVTYDVDPEQAVASRIATLQYVSKNNIPVAGMHIPDTGMGRVVVDKNNGYKFEPVAF